MGKMYISHIYKVELKFIQAQSPKSRATAILKLIFWQVGPECCVWFMIHMVLWVGESYFLCRFIDFT